MEEIDESVLNQSQEATVKPDTNRSDAKAKAAKRFPPRKPPKSKDGMCKQFKNINIPTYSDRKPSLHLITVAAKESLPSPNDEPTTSKKDANAAKPAGKPKYCSC